MEQDSSGSVVRADGAHRAELKLAHTSPLVGGDEWAGRM